MRGLILALMLAFAPVAPVFAVQPDEILADAALEARARAISRDLRCPTCQGESIDDSHAAISRDLRLVVRERLVAGDTDAEVTAYVVDRFGEFVLFNPTKRGANWVLWLAGPGLLLVSLGGAYLYVRKRSTAVPTADLTEAEMARLEKVMKD
jgi:cytochrome c-type biogenesis protein CcmH